MATKLECKFIPLATLPKILVLGPSNKFVPLILFGAYILLLFLILVILIVFAVQKILFWYLLLIFSIIVPKRAGIDNFELIAISLRFNFDSSNKNV
ncbi:Uncharacterised protein [Chlamydia abortus]|nr:Uncharacterised protein [Chlamydia abortus]